MSDSKLWALFFLITTTFALLIQLLVLPYMFPAWHAGNGLLRGGDWIWFHELATNLAEKIRIHGWSEWELRPQGQSAAGIAAAVYALTVSKPWALIPLNAALHASSAILIIKIMRFISPRGMAAVWCAMPFLLYPSAATWYAQIHRDGLSITGALMVLYGWVAIGEATKGSGGSNYKMGRKIFWATLFFFVGVLFIYASRPYLLELIKIVGIVISIILTWAILFSAPWEKVHRIAKSIVIILLWILVLTVQFFKMDPQTRLLEKWSATEAAATEAAATEAATEAATKAATKAAIAEAQSGVTMEAAAKPSFSWNAAHWLPKGLDDKLRGIAFARHGFAQNSGSSNVDAEVAFHDASDVMLYVPRAAQVALLAPFPNQWLKKGSLDSSTMMRKISAIEMTGIYIALFFLPFAIWSWYRHPALWITLIYNVSFLLLFGLAVTNVGTLYRMRYGFIMVLVATGIAGFASMLRYLGRDLATES